jgi:hypothetical protein
MGFTHVRTRKAPNSALHSSRMLLYRRVMIPASALES